MMHIERLHVVTDGAVDERQARHWGARLATEVHAILQAGRSTAPDVRVRELRVTVSRAALGDPGSIARYAGSVARRILDRTPE